MSKYPSHTWHTDLTAVPISGGFWTNWVGDILRRLADLNPGELERLLPDVWQSTHPATPPSLTDRQPSRAA